MNRKILYISECHIYGGSERSIVNIMNFISENPHNKVYFCYRRFNIYQEGLKRDLTNRVIQVPLCLLSYFALSFQIGKRIRNIYAWKFIKLPFWLIKQMGFYDLFNYVLLSIFIRRIKPDIIHINNPAAKQKNLFQKYIDMRIGDYVDVFISGAYQTKQSLQTNRNFPSDKLVQIFNTIERPIISKKGEEIKKQYNIDKNSFVISEVAFLSKRKGQIFLLEALLKIKQSQPDIYKNIILFLVGDGEDYDYLHNFCKTNELNNVVMTGYVPNYADYIYASDLFVLPSIGYEDMPLVILAAMALRKSIISTRVAGIMEEIVDGVSGILLDIDELGHLDKHIIKLFKDERTRDFYAENAQKRYNDLFSRETICSQFELVYDKLMVDKS